MSENDNSNEKHQDPAEPYRTDRKVETEEQEDPKEELEHTDASEIMHGADVGVHTNLRDL